MLFFQIYQIFSQAIRFSIKSNRRFLGVSCSLEFFPFGRLLQAATYFGVAHGSFGSSSKEVKITALAVANGLLAHQMCMVLGCPCLIDFSFVTKNSISYSQRFFEPGILKNFHLFRSSSFIR